MHGLYSAVSVLSSTCSGKAHGAVMVPIIPTPAAALVAAWAAYEPSVLSFNGHAALHPVGFILSRGFSSVKRRFAFTQ
jgi:hypothetical protein